MTLSGQHRAISYRRTAISGRRIAISGRRNALSGQHRALLGQGKTTETSLGPKEDPLRLTEDHQVRTIQIDKELSQTDKGLTQAIFGRM